ncbi:homoserine O-acetyltransferase MetA [Anaerotalea alkaliphila]|uniref:Homoserine O-acetyltransferase n=1 Tax=Anaerotalea alkaliphila TaxID=2662126 RepID=A0A7X5HVU1_9FIRM|nr:homoserine O-succinyltransferase [Anaerotalea alkaliphila]NDL67587.1 homoserine O-succinyltransferase [Anaerotalea alkaliphila]
MPIKIDRNLPAKQILEQENIFVMDEDRAVSQDIRPLKIAILNLMPLKQQTETQLLRMLSNTPLQVEVTLLTPKSYKAKNTPEEHMSSFYTTFDSVKDHKYDGFIITGAPVENMAFEDVIYWKELTEIMDWTRKHVTSTFHICWGAQAGLYHHYGIRKVPLDRKMFGVFKHHVVVEHHNLLRGFDHEFMAPHSRHTTVLAEDIIAHPELELLSVSPEAGVYIAMSKDGKQVFVTGHSEYDPLTLYQEYMRDKEKGLPIDIPKNYFPQNDPSLTPESTWKSHAHLLYANWLNYYVYQVTPYLIDTVGDD